MIKSVAFTPKVSLSLGVIHAARRRDNAMGGNDHFLRASRIHALHTHAQDARKTEHTPSHTQKTSFQADDFASCAMKMSYIGALTAKR